MQSRLVSSILGGIIGGLGYGIGAYFMRNYGLPEGILASITFGLLAIVPSMLAVSNFVELEIKEKSNDGYKIRSENTSENYLIAKNWEFNPDLSKQEERTIYKKSPSEQNFKVD